MKWYPKASRKFEPGDRLLCFGKLVAMREMIPARKKRRARVRKLPQDPLSGGEPPES